MTGAGAVCLWTRGGSCSSSGILSLSFNGLRLGLFLNRVGTRWLVINSTASLQRSIMSCPNDGQPGSSLVAVVSRTGRENFSLPGCSSSKLVSVPSCCNIKQKPSLFGTYS